MEKVPNGSVPNWFMGGFVCSRTQNRRATFALDSFEIPILAENRHVNKRGWGNNFQLEHADEWLNWLGLDGSSRTGEAIHHR